MVLDWVHVYACYFLRVDFLTILKETNDVILSYLIDQGVKFKERFFFCMMKLKLIIFLPCNGKD